MYESVVCEHMPKTATARNNATNWNKEVCWAKKFSFPKNMGRSRRPETENFFGCGLIF